MGEFFRGWRRKLGLLTLLMALVMMAGWVRSLLVHDLILFNSSYEQGALAGIVTARNSLNVMANEMSDSDFDLNDTLPTHVLDVSQMFRFFAPVYESTATLIVVNQNSAPTTPILQPMPILVIPYWSITIPLTLISVWLLLSKPRKSTQMKITEPTNVEVT